MWASSSIRPATSTRRSGCLREWTEEHGIELVQIAAPYPQRSIAEEGDAGDTDLIVSIGGDGTTLAALRAGAGARRPVLGIGCGSLGALANVTAADLPGALERFVRGEWRPRLFPALWVARTDGEAVFALNDVALVRESGSQVRLSAYVDGTLFARVAGDGAVVSTPIGTSGYAISAGGPLLLTGIDAYVLTPLPKHGGFAPPLVIGADCELELDAAASFGGVRLEVDGQVAGSGVGVGDGEVPAGDGHAGQPSTTTSRFCRGCAAVRILVDSPRFLAEDARRGLSCPPGIREPDRDRETALGTRGGGEPRVVGVGDRLHDRQPEAEPFPAVGVPGCDRAVSVEAGERLDAAPRADQDATTGPEFETSSVGLPSRDPVHASTHPSGSL